jgi:hypothetical protein
MQMNYAKTRREAAMEDELSHKHIATKEEAQRLFNFFRDSRLLDWKHANNDCEDRANAICILLDAWGLPNSKGWVFSGDFLKKGTGRLQNLWNYHVAAAIPVQEKSGIHYYIIDPATLSQVETIETWSENITDNAFSYHLIKNSHYYIFNGESIRKENWHKRDKQNFKWTIQGLAGINGMAPKAKAMLCFCKHIIEKKRQEFLAVKKAGINYR